MALAQIELFQLHRAATAGIIIERNIEPEFAISDHLIAVLRDQEQTVRIANINCNRIRRIDLVEKQVEIFGAVERPKGLNKAGGAQVGQGGGIIDARGAINDHRRVFACFACNFHTSQPYDVAAQQSHTGFAGRSASVIVRFEIETMQARPTAPLPKGFPFHAGCQFDPACVRASM